MDLKRIGLILGLIWIIIWMVLHITETPMAFEISSGISIMFLLIAIFLTVRRHYTGEGRSLFLDDVKAAMKQAAIYTLVTAAFTYVYFKYVNPEFLENKIEMRVSAEEERIDKVGWEEFVKENKAGNPSLVDQSKEDYLDDAKSTAKSFLSAGFIFILSLVGMITISFLYSLVVTALYRRLLYKYDTKQ